MEKASNRRNRQAAKSIPSREAKRVRKAARLQSWKNRFERRLKLLTEDTWHYVPAKENLAKYLDAMVFVLEGERARLAKISNALLSIPEGVE